MSQDLLRERRFTATNYITQASNAGKPMTDEQRALYSATKALTWGWLIGSGEKKITPQPDAKRVAERLLALLAEPAEGDTVVGKGPMTGAWFAGRYLGPSVRWRGESEVSIQGRTMNLLTSTLRVVERA